MKIQCAYGWAQRSGYFPNGKPAVKWVTTEAEAHAFTAAEIKQIRSRAKAWGFKTQVKHDDEQ